MRAKFKIFFFTAVDEFPISLMRGFHLDLSGEKQEK